MYNKHAKLNSKFIQSLRTVCQKKADEHLNPLLVAYKTLNDISLTLSQLSIMLSTAHPSAQLLELKQEGILVIPTCEDVLEFIDTIIANGEDINSKSKEGYGILHICSYPEIIKKVAEAGGDINISYNVRDFSGQTHNTPLHYFALQFDPELTRTQFEQFCDTLKLFLDLGADPNKARLIPSMARGMANIKTDEEREKAIKVLDMALFYGADINQTDSMGKNAVTYINDPDILQYLIGHKSDPSKCYYKIGEDQHLCSQLWWALFHRKEKKVEILLEAGADPNICHTDLFVLTPISPPLFALLHDPCHREAVNEHEISEKLIRLMVKYGADINMTDGNGDSLLTHKYGISLPIRTLIELGADVNYVSPKEGATPLHSIVNVLKYANSQGNREVWLDNINALIEAGVDINAKNNRGETPFQNACIYYADKHRKKDFSKETDISLLEILIKNGADINTPEFEVLPKRVQKELTKFAEYREALETTNDSDIDCFER